MTPVMSVSNLVIDVTDLDRAAAFWAALLDLDVSRRESDWVDLAALGAAGPVLSFQLVPEEKTIKNRLHLDIAVEASSGGAVAAGRRALALGGTPASELFGADGAPWQVWRDPEGNEFCLCTVSSPRSDSSAGGAAGRSADVVQGY